MLFFLAVVTAKKHHCRACADPWAGGVPHTKNDVSWVSCKYPRDALTQAWQAYWTPLGRPTPQAERRAQHQTRTSIAFFDRRRPPAGGLGTCDGSRARVNCHAGSSDSSDCQGVQVSREGESARVGANRRVDAKTLNRIFSLFVRSPRGTRTPVPQPPSPSPPARDAARTAPAAAGPPLLPLSPSRPVTYIRRGTNRASSSI